MKFHSSQWYPAMFQHVGWVIFCFHSLDLSSVGAIAALKPSTAHAACRTQGPGAPALARSRMLRDSALPILLRKRAGSSISLHFHLSPCLCGSVPFIQFAFSQLLFSVSSEKTSTFKSKHLTVYQIKETWAGFEF